MPENHPREGNIPGTVDLSVLDGEATGSSYGQALYPVPTDDPNDPLQWPAWKKNAILVIVSLYSFLGNCALVGPSVYISIYSEEFDISHADASGLISYPNFAFGFGSLILVPMYLKFGRRLVMLLSMAMFLAGLIGAPRATSFSGLMVARVFHGFGSGVCESLPVQLVNDIFYLHERGKRIGYYTVCLCLGSTGPLYVGYMLAGGYSWRLFFYVVAAFAGALLVAAFFLAQFFGTILRSFTCFLVPAVLWVITSFGIYIGLGALTFNYTFPLLITSPPYSWPQTSSGLIALATILGFLLALPFTATSDSLAAKLTKRNNSIREAEMRLPALLPGAFIAPAGLIVYGLTAQLTLHWTGFFAGVAMVQFGS
ncbi:major facilitator superfamily domain-containing protein [Aspergillus cavernicola]|uniref:Major facilitator superfamily domain-containing protein n=1 Tax=Aspergillus cavernicola TaxID=176166 RepID=A0ABR4J4Q4_9EURO